MLQTYGEGKDEKDEEDEEDVIDGNIHWMCRLYRYCCWWWREADRSEYRETGSN